MDPIVFCLTYINALAYGGLAVLRLLHLYKAEYSCSLTTKLQMMEGHSSTLYIVIPALFSYLLIFSPIRVSALLTHIHK